jgi:hypothetical protein
LRLQDEPLCQQQVVAALEPCGEVAVAAHITGRGELEEERRKPLDADCRSTSLDIR